MTNQIKKLLLFFFTISLATNCKLQAVKNPNPSADKSGTYNVKIDSLMKATFNRGLFNGSILVLRNDSIIYKNSLGYTDASKTKKLNSNMVFNIGSISKELSAASIMMLVEENKIGLADKISKFNLGLPNWADKIKVGDLLNYSSGLPRYNWDKVRSNKDVYSDLKNIERLEFEPGTDYLYSNNNVFIRKLIIERISGIPFNEFIKKRILTPLKMKNTFLSPAKETAQFATAFNNDGVNYEEIYQMDGGTYTTPDDLYKWIQGLYAEKIISTESINILGTPLAHKNANQSSLGFTTIENGTISRHQASGSNVDFETILDYNLENGLTTILMTNNANYKLWDLNRAINAILNDQTFYAPNNSIKDAIKEKCKVNIHDGIAYYKELRNKDIEAFNFENPNELNGLGYEFLNQNRVKDAIEIFKLLVAEFPDLANPYDSLGEAYDKDNNLELALVNYQKSLELNPKNRHAEKMIFKINYKIRERPKFDQVFTKQQYMDDMDELAKRLVETHPTPFEFTTKEVFYSLVNSQKEKIKENMTFGAFIWLLTPIQASIGCEHTQSDQFFIENNMLPIHLRFPIEAELINSKLLVTNVHHNSAVPLGSTIKSINGVPVAKIIDEVFKHIPTNGHSKALKRATFNRFITSYVPYYLNFPETYKITLEENKKPIRLSPLTSFEIEFLKKKKALDFKPIADGIAALKIRNFSFYGGERWEEYTAFIDSSFIEINKKGIKDLVIDLRGNYGGCSCATIYLLQHISKEPFTYFSPDLPSLPGNKSENKEKILSNNHFSGNTYIIQDGFNTSTTGHFLAMVKHNSIATLVGEESGSGHYSNGNSKEFLGTNTGAFYLIGQTYYEVTANDFPKNRGILPDHFVYKTSKDIAEGKDAQMEYVLNLINE